VVKHMHGRVSVAHAVDRYYPLDCSNKSWLTAFLLSVECGQTVQCREPGHQQRVKRLPRNRRYGFYYVNGYRCKTGNRLQG